MAAICLLRDRRDGVGAACHAAGQMDAASRLKANPATSPATSPAAAPPLTDRRHPIDPAEAANPGALLPPSSLVKLPNEYLKRKQSAKALQTTPDPQRG